MNKINISKNLFKSKTDILLETLQPFMFNNDRLNENNMKSNSKSNEGEKVEVEAEAEANTDSTVFSVKASDDPIPIPNSFCPKEKDKLFWCFFIMKHGFVEYEKLRLDIEKHESINIVVEKKLKIEYVDKLRENKNIIKKYKIAPLTDVENYLVNENVIDVKTFLILCILEELSVLYLRKNTYYDLSFVSSDTETNKQHVIVCHSPFKYTYECEKTFLDIETYKNTYYKLEQIDKPVKAFSSYKLPELVEICQKLSLNIIDLCTLKKKTKQELYESIIQYF
jgi:hypothetical protein